MKSFRWGSSVSLQLAATRGFSMRDVHVAGIRHSHMKALTSAATILEVLNLKNNEFSGTLPNITSLPDALGKRFSSVILFCL